MIKDHKFTFYKIAYYLLNAIIAVTIFALGSLVLNANVLAVIDLPKLSVIVIIALIIILLDAQLAYKLHQN